MNWKRILTKCFYAVFLLNAVCLFSAENKPFDPDILYLTWQRSPESTMTIQWISDPDQREDFVAFKNENDKEWSSASGFHFPMPEGHPYLIHRLELTQLLPNTTYQFRIGQEGVIYKFSTMPKDLNAPIKFIVGGDIYHDTIEIVKEMNTRAANHSPQFALAAGDLAYTSDVYGVWQRWGLAKEKFKRWMSWLIAWKQTMVTPEGKLIPIITAIGNHDVMGRFNQTPDQARIYYALFPLPGYHAMDFGQYMTLFVLDTDHTHPIKGKQSDWLKSALSARKNVPNKFALYHVGAYPSVRQFSGDTHKLIRKHWVPSFEDYGINVAFEHHDHSYKRTHPILKGKIDPKGVVYIGDGAWGIEKPRSPRMHRWYIDKGAQSRNVIVVTIDKNKRVFKAIDQQGKVIDEYRQERNSVDQ